MEALPKPVLIIFALTTLFAIWQFYRASNNSKIFLSLVLPWIALISFLGINDFYKEFQSTPPNFIFLIGPPLIFAIVFPFTNAGKKFIHGLSLSRLTILHVLRIPVEITLYYTASVKLIPMLMTFEGYNFDIISGISAPVIYYLVFVSQKSNYRLLLVWNFVCLGLLLNILTIALLSAPTVFQQLAFELPNIGVAYFPLVWLPGIIVPIVFFSHIASIIQLTRGSLKK